MADILVFPNSYTEKTAHCLCCGYEWTTRSSMPIECPACKCKKGIFKEFVFGQEHDFRCRKCNGFLFTITPLMEFRCSHCGHVNEYDDLICAE